MIWQFNYHRGPASLVGMVETTNEDERVAMEVATAWCVQNGMRPPAGIRRMILADEGILKAVVPVVEEVPVLVDAVAATTGTPMEKTGLGQRIVAALNKPVI